MADKDPLKADLPPNPLSNAKVFGHSGAIAEPEILEGVDMGHPAIDSAPRKGLPEASYRIDLNDPTLDGSEAVRLRLEQQGSTAASGKPAPAAPKADDKKP